MEKAHAVQAVQVDETFLSLTVDGRGYRIRWADCSPRLARAMQSQRERFEITPSGYGIHWSEIDEDLAIMPLLQSAELVEAQVA
jgi:hypothetical protein